MKVNAGRYTADLDESVETRDGETGRMPRLNVRVCLLW
jgi:hypothetical protein